ncbi:MAG: uncharacterized protein QG663_726, partial [Thermodesulfobacteriota bacterium]|nr:uncharacterized protein [Thermodesulfobacteriota bacterium]
MLRHALPEAVSLDLLDASLYLELSRDPHRLEAIIGQKPEGTWILLDEIQKAPELLDEVHRLMESRRWRFALCGSSARKLRRGGANLLAGRAVTVNLEGFSAKELGTNFDLMRSVSWGMLPFVQEDPDQAPEILSAYLNTYLREEVREEGLVRRVPPFVRFLNLAGQFNGQQVNLVNIAREAAVSRSTVDTYTKPAKRYPVTEDAERNPSPFFPYAYNKGKCENILTAAYERGDFPLTIIRPAYTYGEGRGILHTFGGGNYYLKRIR